MRRILSGSILCLVALGGSGRARADDAPAPPASPSPSPSPTDDRLRAELARQGAELAELRAAIAEEKKQREAGETKAALWDRLGLQFSGFTQVDWVIHNQSSQNEINGSTGLLLNQDRFELRREHLRLDIDQGLVLGRVEIDANTTNGPQVRPIDAEVSLRWPRKHDDQGRWPELLATLGLMRIPFGYEVQELDYVRPFLERATVLQAFFPGEFDLGARLGARYRFVDAVIAVMNGNPHRATRCSPRSRR